MLEDLTVWDALALFTKLVAYVGCFLSAGSFLYSSASPGLPASIKFRLHDIIVAFAVIGAAGSIAQIGVQSGRLLDEGIAGMIDSEMLELATNGPLGTSVLLRIGGLVIIVLAVFSIPLSRWIGMSGALVTVSAFSFVGHGTNEPRLLMATLVTVHLSGVAFWLGALWPLRKMTSAGDNANCLSALAHRFGQQAAWIVGALIIAGSILVYQIVGSVHNLINSQFGLTLLVKLIVVAGLLLLAAANKLRFVPEIQKGNESAKNHLRQSITIEMTLAAVILAITAVLTTITPLPELSEMTHD